MTSYIDTMTKQFYDGANILDKVILIRKIKKNIGFRADSYHQSIFQQGGEHSSIAKQKTMVNKRRKLVTEQMLGCHKRKRVNIL